MGLPAAELIVKLFALFFEAITVPLALYARSRTRAWLDTALAGIAQPADVAEAEA